MATPRFLFSGELGLGRVGTVPTLFLMADFLLEGQPAALRLAARAWLSQSLDQIERSLTSYKKMFCTRKLTSLSCRILEPLLAELLSPSTARRGNRFFWPYNKLSLHFHHSSHLWSWFHTRYEGVYDGARVVYIQKLIRAMVDVGAPLLLHHAAARPISPVLITLNDAQCLPPPPIPYTSDGEQ